MTHWSRRRVLSALSLLTAVAAAPRVLGAAISRLFPKPGSDDFFIRHNDQPWALETLRSAYGVGPITPISHFLSATTCRCQPIPSLHLPMIGL